MARSRPESAGDGARRCQTVVGDELLFRGILLSKMRGVFGRLDWVANGLLFGLYPLHQPWSIVGTMAHGVVLYALPSARFSLPRDGAAVAPRGACQ
ncbi:MAG: CPBP family intramembrane metalloprotease [Chloroflexota bacterium]|nr:CPBP family intramembrane metalloprotease [Chloroflexota bacterium]